MIDGNDLIALLGKSERDEQIKKMLADLGIKTPLPRPKKGEDQVGVSPRNKSLDLNFQDAITVFPESENHAEGELIFDTIFFYPDAFSKKDVPIIFPFELNANIDRIKAREMFGKPEWTSHVMNNDRWTISGYEMLLVFDDNEKSIHQIAISKITK